MMFQTLHVRLLRSSDDDTTIAEQRAGSIPPYTACSCCICPLDGQFRHHAQVPALLAGVGNPLAQLKDMPRTCNVAAAARRGCHPAEGQQIWALTVAAVSHM